MSFAYNTNTAYDYRRYGEQEEYERCEKPAQKPASRAAVMTRRAVLLLAALIVAAICIGMVYVKAQVFMTQRHVNETRNAIIEAKQQHSVLSEQYNQATNLNTIMDKAGRLGMGYPSAEQILYVSVQGSPADMEMKN